MATTMAAPLHSSQTQPQPQPSEEQTQHQKLVQPKRTIGATLLSNWVEERACCALGLDDQPVSRAHAGLLVHGADTHDPKAFETTQQAMSSLIAAKIAPTMPSSKRHSTGGKRGAMRDERLMRQALSDATAEAARNAARESAAGADAGWISTHAKDYGHEDLYGRIPELGTVPPSEEDVRRFETPITFWSDFAVKGSGTTVSSSKTEDLQRRGRQGGGYSYTWTGSQERKAVVGHRAGQANQHHASPASVSFGKHADFTTPIKEYAKGPVKDL
ncbi:hypothetical protein DFJ77DRAFT_468352 [Powellomyces hirtus]|nr:hypothetical protein DFJ77DRAFT_468352 [Powellomyces hirtus]